MDLVERSFHARLVDLYSKLYFQPGVVHPHKPRLQLKLYQGWDELGWLAIWRARNVHYSKLVKIEV